MSSYTIHKLHLGGYMIMQASTDNAFNANATYPLFACTELAEALVFLKAKFIEKQNAPSSS